MTEDLKERAVATVRSKMSLLFSTRYQYFHNHKRKFKVLKHHEILANALDRVYAGKCTRLIISMPPRYGKTELGVKNFIATGLAINPAALFIHLSASAPLALENSEGAKDIVNSPSYQQLFPEVRIKQGSDSKAKWYTTAGGGVYAASASGQVTGFGAGRTTTEKEDEEEALFKAIEQIEEMERQNHLFAGALIIDDAIKADDADSKVKRERVNNRWPNTIKSRLNSKRTPVIVIMQRLHEEDLAGFLQKTEPGEWEVINIPALWVDENGEMQCLDPSKHTVEDLIAMRDSENEETRITFQRQFQQNPTPREGLLFPREGLNFYNPKTINVDEMAEYRFCYIDPANEGGDDLSAPVSYLVKNKIYIVDVIYNSDGTDINEGGCVDLIQRHKCQSVRVEGNSAWYLFANGVKAKLNKAGHFPNYRVLKNTTNKHTRILAQSAFIVQHCVFRSDWETFSPQYRRFMQNIFEYRKKQEGTDKNKHDDAPDSMAGIAHHHATDFKHLW